MTLVAAAFVLDMMEEAKPSAKSPWKDTYVTSAQAIASAANASPLFAGDDGPARTAAIMVGVAEMESTFNPKAKGDGKCLEHEERPTMFGLGALLLTEARCIRRGPPESFCLFQVHQSNFSALGISEEEILGNVSICATAGLRMMHISFKLCSGAQWRPLDRLNQYATGGGVCVRPLHDEGEHRVRRGMGLYRWKLAKDKSAP